MGALRGLLLVDLGDAVEHVEARVGEGGLGRPGALLGPARRLQPYYFFRTHAIIVFT